MTPESPEVALARYVAEVCHELRTPVAVMSLVSELDPEGDIDRDGLVDVLNTVRRQTVLLRRVIDKYLEHGVLVDTAWNDVAVEFDLGTEVAATLDSLLPLLPANRIRRRLVPAGAFGDVGRVRSIVVNLVLNAAKYSPEDTVVDVEVAAEGSAVILRVSDRGIGVPVDERDQILEPFRRGTNADERAVSGTGLGLAIVAAHLRALDGSVEVSDRSGGGTVMTVRLPALRTGSHAR